MRRYEPWHLELELDGRLAYEGDAAGVFLSNFPLFAYGFKIDPLADVADGRLAAVILEAESRHRVARLVLSAYRGTLRATPQRHRHAGARGGPHDARADGLRLGGARNDDRVGPGGTGASEDRGVSRLARTSFAFLAAFGLAEVGVGLARAATTTYVPVLLDRISHSPALIGAVMLVNAAAGFAVPLAVGLWSDRRSRRRPRAGGRPFVIGGVAVTSAGLLAVAAGAETSYPVLGLAAGCVYLGLNATATAHRAVVVERFEDGRRPAATSSQELAMLDRRPARAGGRRRADRGATPRSSSWSPRSWRRCSRCPPPSC